MESIKKKISKTKADQIRDDLLSLSLKANLTRVELADLLDGSKSMVDKYFAKKRSPTHIERSESAMRISNFLSRMLDEGVLPVQRKDTWDTITSYIEQHSAADQT